MNNKNNFNKYKWNDSMILDKIQEILENKNIDELELTDEELEEINQSAYIIAQNIDELKVLPDDDIKEYILRLQNYLNSTNFKCIKAEFKGIEFDVSKNLSFDDIFNEYYSKYDKIYGISQMLSDLGLK